MSKQGNNLKQRARLRKKAEETGWSVGRSFLGMSFDDTHIKLQKAGLTVYRDKDSIFGPKEQTEQALQILGDDYAQSR